MPVTQYGLLQALTSFLGKSLDQEQAAAHIATVTEFVKSYTRGRGFAPNGAVNEDLAAVIVTVSARLLSSPTLVSRKEVGSMVLMFTPFNGFTVPEMLVLNRYRQRVA